MPLARLSVPMHLSVQRVKALADAVHAALVATCNVPENDRFQLISRFPADAMIMDPTYIDANRTIDASIVEITLLRGRTDDKKRKLYRHLVDQAVAGGFVADDIMVSLTENATIDWSLSSGNAFARP